MNESETTPEVAPEATPETTQNCICTSKHEGPCPSNLSEDTVETKPEVVAPEVVSEGTPEQPVVNMPNVAPTEKLEAPEELMPTDTDSEAKAQMRSTYLAYWKQSGQEKWDSEKETLMAKLEALA